MSLSILAYGLVLGGFLTGAAFLLDRSLRGLGSPTRWVWAAALLATAGLPLLFLVWTPTSATSGPNASIPAEVLLEALASLPVNEVGQPDLFSALQTALPWLWAGTSFLFLGMLAWAGARLRQATRRFERRTMDGADVLLSTGLGPAVLGLLRPVIILPRWALEMERSKLDLILLHEREHVAARDPLLLLVGLLCVASSPWNPWVWLLARQLHVAVEGDCDRRVLARGITPKRYGDLLLEVASGRQSPSLLMPALAEGGRSVLERRLHMIRDAVRNRGIGAVILGGLGSAALLVLACETPTPPAVDQAQEPALKVETSGVMTAAEVPDLSEAGEGYFLFRKQGEKVEYVGPVAPGELEFTPDGEGEARFYFKGGEPLPVVEGVGSDDAKAEFHFQAAEGATKAGSVLRLRETESEAPPPLIVVDGVIMSDPDFLETVDKDRIARVEVIKGTAAQAQYGDRGAHGVILITTKR